MQLLCLNSATNFRCYKLVALHACFGVPQRRSPAVGGVWGERMYVHADASCVVSYARVSAVISRTVTLAARFEIAYIGTDQAKGLACCACRTDTSILSTENNVRSLFQQDSPLELLIESKAFSFTLRNLQAVELPSTVGLGFGAPRPTPFDYAHECHTECTELCQVDLVAGHASCRDCIEVTGLGRREST